MASGGRGVLSSLLGLHAELERMIHDVVGEGTHVGSPRKWAPAADVFVSGGNVVVRFDVAGVKSEEIDVTYHKGELSISGVRMEWGEEPKEGYWQMEISHGHFERRIKIPMPVDPDGISAAAREGILEVRLPVADEERGGSVRIRTDG